MNISFKKIDTNNINYKLIHKWCSNKHVYEWFEQRILSLDEITNKYKNKIEIKKQNICIIQYNGIDIGLLQFYKFENDINIPQISDFNNVYEFDLYIGEKEYISKGIGTNIIRLAKEMIYNNYNADAIILRPFKRNIRAIKCYTKNDFKIIDEYIGKDSIGNKETILVLLNSKN